MLPCPKETSFGVLPSGCFSGQTEFFPSLAEGSFPSFASEKIISLIQQNRREMKELISNVVSSLITGSSLVPFLQNSVWRKARGW